MLSLQGPRSRDLLGALLDDDGGALPEPLRNELSVVHIGGAEIWVARTGYTGEPLCFELFVAAGHGPALWDALVETGAAPVGLGARDTLRLEAGLPLYGHELGVDPDGREIPVYAIGLAPFAVSFSPLKGDFVGREALARQQAAFGRILARDFSDIEALPRRVQPVAVAGRGVVRQGDRVVRPDRGTSGDGEAAGGEALGWVTSGTAVPYWGIDGEGLCSTHTDEHELRSIALAYVDSRLLEDDEVEIEVRGRILPGLVVPYHLRSDAPPCARPSSGTTRHSSPSSRAARAARRRCACSPRPPTTTSGVSASAST